MNTEVLGRKPDIDLTKLNGTRGEGEAGGLRKARKSLPAWGHGYAEALEYGCEGLSGVKLQGRVYIGTDIKGT